MRQPFSRSAIYAVIGIGLLILVISQLTGRDTESVRSVEHPFDSLDNYRPGLSVPEAASLPVVTPAAPMPVAPMHIASRPVAPLYLAPQAIAPQPIAAQSIASLPIGIEQLPLPVPAPVDSQFDRVREIAADLPEMPATEIAADSPNKSPFSYPLSNLGAEKSDAIELNIEDDSIAINDTSVAQADEATDSFSEASDSWAMSDFPVDAMEIQPKMTPAAVTEPQTELQVSAMDDQFASTETTELPESAQQPEKSWDIRAAQKGWKKNPFTSDATPAALPQPGDTSTYSDLLPTAMLPPHDEKQIPSNFTDTTNQLATASAIEESGTFALGIAPPMVEQETMRSVMDSQESLGLNSPPIHVGLSETDAQKAAHNIEYGKSLSRRGASFAAQQEFYSSLRILAQSHDSSIKGTPYTAALRNGITALKEAEDFIDSDTETQIGLDVAYIIETHSSKVFSAATAKDMTAIEAVQRYLAYASHHLALAGGENVVASEALYCLGKLHSAQAKLGSSPAKLDVAKSLAFHQAAVTADRGNHRSLNELGVLYANSGRFNESKAMLKKSLRIHQLPQAWQNLGVIHQRLGEHQLAELAMKEHQIVSTQTPDSTIRWTGVEEFNKNAPMVQRTASQTNQAPPVPKPQSLGNRILNSIR